MSRSTALNWIISRSIQPACVILYTSLLSTIQGVNELIVKNKSSSLASVAAVASDGLDLFKRT